MGKKKDEEVKVVQDLELLGEKAEHNKNVYELLDEAMFTSAHVKREEVRRGVVNIDNVYPTTEAETLKMKELLDKAENAFDDAHAEDVTFLNERLNELRYIVDWSLDRHWTFSFKIILGVIISLFVFKQCSDSSKEDAQAVEKEMAVIEKWDKDEPVTIEEILRKGSSPQYTFPDYSSAATYRRTAVNNLAYNISNARKSIESNKQKLDTASTDAVKKTLNVHIASSEKTIKRNTEKYEEIKNSDLNGLKKIALKEKEAQLDKYNSDSGRMKFLFIFFIILTPLYIIANRPHGYNITKHRLEGEMLNGLRKAGWALAGVLAGVGASIGFVDVVTKWSDGSTTRSDDGTGPARLAIKIGLLAAALFVFCLTSCLIMTYSTISGLIHNYNWTAIFNKVKAATEKKA